ncbi:LysE/ArgO family amino acid transporter [Halarcobacter ebronensis]|uniref:Amino acid transporter n=1 Tax=Halarcobacter ebronensis TaxID=1462615 RepID=A0A4Q1AI56_9BACT|nr:LysE/ArgO family amino acid transporter [Halarcobacter ebronensis]QKF83055.1 transporter, LysE family [Halarcobacter ebronensis]RXK02425.1 amino acid transporter [Halarcobacter ebronensis]
MEFEIFLKGFIIAISLIVAIGAQNAYILKLGLLRQHVSKAVLFCVLSDIFLISLGVLGLGFFIKGEQLFINAIAIFGIVFLCFYAYTSFKSALNNQSMKIDDKIKTNPLKQVLTLLFVFTYLNPHTYLDTILLIGGIGANIESFYKIYFILGCATASTLWFVTLGYGARVLIPLFKKPLTWKILDISIGVLMLYIAYSLKDLIIL